MTLLLSQAVLTRDPALDDQLNSGLYEPVFVAFSQRDEDSNEVIRFVGFDRAMVEDMGDPEQVTIAVEPGAKLESKA